MASSNTTNMGLIVPTVGGEDGPLYAQDINNDLFLLDTHDHSPGRGVQITPNGMNVNSSLTVNNNFITNIAGLTLFAQTAVPIINTLYLNGVDLYYVDGAGNNVRVTQSGGIAGSPGSIANLVSPASATYVAGSSTFVWQSGVSTAANMDFGAAVFRNISPNSTYSLTLEPPNLTSNYTLTLPLAPIAKRILSMDSAGVIAADTFVDNTTITYISNTLAVATSGINTAQLADAAVTTIKIADGSITGPKFANGTYPGAVSQQLTGTGNFTVPVGVHSLTAYGIGGGGGGGGGGGASSIFGPGGGGGAGAHGSEITFLVTPGDVINYVVPGIGGAGGSGIINNAFNNPGSQGANTIFGSFFFVGANGGQGSWVVASLSQPAALGGTGPSVFYNAGGNGGAGNAGGNAGSGGASNTVYAYTGAYNTASTSGAGGGSFAAGNGGGGGGASPLGAGAGSGGNSPQAPGSGSSIAGGGGGGGAGTVATTGGAGGYGGQGYLRISWVA